MFPDWLIYTFLRDRSIPSAWIMAGGYGERAWEPAASFLIRCEGSVPKNPLSRERLGTV
jgi:hypothetical protein